MSAHDLLIARLRRGEIGAILRRATLCAIIAAMAAIALLGVSGWFLTAAAMAGLAGSAAVAAFNYLIPSAAIRLLAIVRTASRYGERLWSHRAALLAMADLRARLFERLAAQDSRTAPNLSSGDACGRLIGDIAALEDLVVRRPTQRAGVVAVGIAVGFVALAGWRPALSIAALLALLPLVLKTVADRVTRAPAREAAEALGDVRERYVEFAAARAEIAAYGLVWMVERDLAAPLARLDAARARLFHAEAVIAALLALATGVAAALVLATSRASAPLVALAVLAAAAGVEAMGGLARTAFRQAAVKEGLRRLAAIDAAPPRPARDPAPPGPARLALGATRLAVGERLAITGASGSGKTMLIEALAGIRPSAFDLKLDDTPIADWAADRLRLQTALVAQDAPMLAGTIADNLRLARPGVDAAAMAEVLAIAGLDARIATMPDGVDTPLGEAGGILSGGERKRLALARALLARRPWLLLDEPTEGLDAATEGALVTRLDAWLEQTGTGLVLVSHRLAPLRLATRHVAIGEIARVRAAAS